MFARITLATPDPRGSIIGGETEVENRIEFDTVRKKARYYIRLVTEFDPTGDSTEFGVQSKEIIVDVPNATLSAMLTSIVQLGKDQGLIPATATVQILDL